MCFRKFALCFATVPKPVVRIKKRFLLKLDVVVSAPSQCVVQVKSRYQTFSLFFVSCQRCPPDLAPLPPAREGQNREEALLLGQLVEPAIVRHDETLESTACDVLSVYPLSIARQVEEPCRNNLAIQD